MLHKLTKQLVNGLDEWVDGGDFHGTAHWCVLKDASSWGQMLPNQGALYGLLGANTRWRDLEGNHIEYVKNTLQECSITYTKSDWLYETHKDKSSILVREFRREDDPTQKCYIQELYVKGFCLHTIYLKDSKQSPCVDGSRTLIVMPYQSKGWIQYQPEQEQGAQAA